MRTRLTAALLGLTSTLATAHSGHGFTGAHLHASDLFGPGALLLALATGIAALAWSRRK